MFCQDKTVSQQIFDSCLVYMVYVILILKLTKTEVVVVFIGITTVL